MNASTKKSKSTNVSKGYFDVDKYASEEIHQGAITSSPKSRNASGIQVAKINTVSSNYRKSQTKGFR